MPEFLVIASPDSPDATDDLNRRGRVLASLPPRLFVIDAADAAAVELRAIPGIEAVLSCGDASLPASLSDAERLFAEAWRAKGAPKQRAGEGKRWDAEGFLPPDRPSD